ncbi:hypothetical protein RV134_190048 [Roseovarius sp. EC-HK134]|nr:hypothetical protein RV134_190048 [Roseovarius sp. EC-HK134]VVS99731.1 hypothetical protein RV420_220135 [Roseovarius sp. EC-SD190]
MKPEPHGIAGSPRVTLAGATTMKSGSFGGNQRQTMIDSRLEREFFSARLVDPCPNTGWTSP